MTPRAAIILLVIMSIVSGIFLSYLFFSSKPADNPIDYAQTQNAGRVEAEKQIETPKKPASAVERKAEINSKLEEFRKSTTGTSSSASISASSTLKDAQIKEKQAQILSELEKFRNSIKK